MSVDTTVEGEASAHPTYQLLVGDCRVELTGAESRMYQGQAVVLVKPDGTVLVHDTEGYKPVAWLTRAEKVAEDRENGTITAVDGDTWLRIDVEQPVIDRELPGSPAGEPVGDCPSCGGTLVSVRNAVHCITCHDRYGLPTDGTLLEQQCGCGLPTMSVDRGETFEVCIDRSCEPLDPLIADRFDGVWSCPDSNCAGTLRVIRRSGLLLGCDQYPDCEEAFRFPAGTLEGHCGCGLPRFSTDGNSGCIDTTCTAE